MTAVTPLCNGQEKRLQIPNNILGEEEQYNESGLVTLPKKSVLLGKEIQVPNAVINEIPIIYPQIKKE